MLRANSGKMSGAAHKKKGGRFWAGDDSSGSDSDSSDASNSSSDGELHGKIAQQNKANATKWIIEDEDEGDDEKRVVRTQEDKNSEKLVGHLKRVTNALKINDFNTIQEAWGKTVAAREKVNISLTLSAQKEFVKVLRKLHRATNDFTAAGRKKLSKTNAKALNRVRNTVAKMVKSDTYKVLFTLRLGNGAEA